MRLFHTPLAAGLALAAVACGPPQETRDTRPGIVTERAQACRTMLREFVSVDTREMTEAELEAAMQRASANATPCGDAFDAEADTPGERQMAQHEGRQFQLYALMFEGTLSERFDDYAAYCPIVADTFQLLLANIAELEAVLQRDDVAEDERSQLAELRDLDLEALDVLFIASEEHCQ